MTALDTQLIDAYTGGVNMPASDNAGNTVRVNSDGTNLEYVGVQELAGSGAWDGAADRVLVTGSGVRTVTIPDAATVGQEILIVDASGNAATGTITLDPAGSSSINGVSTLALTTNYSSARLVYVAVSTWVRV
jgi:hypothetical protein